MAASDVPGADASSAEAPKDNQLCVDLQIISPSVGVTRPLVFPGLPASTTLLQLKDMIRQTLPMRPPDDHQRLIHRGRALTRDTDTILDILGESAVRSNEQQTMHLVIRELSTAPASATPTTRDRSPAPAPGQAPAQRPLAPQPAPPPGFPRRNPVQPSFTAPPVTTTATSPVPNNGHVNNDALPAMQHHHQHMSNWLAQLQRDSRARTLVSQNQRTRAMLGMRGIGDTPVNQGPGQEPPIARAASPALGHYYRETIGPNGQTYQVETVIRGTAPSSAPPGGLSPADVQTILRNADLAQATTAMTNAMHRSASGASLHSLYSAGRPLNQPGVTTPAYPHAFPSSHSPAPSGRATPDLVGRTSNSNLRSASAGSSTLALQQPQQPQQPPRQGSEVYILSSPEGPRGILVNNSSETYYTPRIPTPAASHLRLRNMFSPISTHPPTPHLDQQQQQQQQQPPPYPALNPHWQPQVPQPHNQGADAQAQQPQARGVPPQDGVNDPDNPQEPGLPPLLLQAWPHIWLIFRLALFVWFFTSPQASWGRWLSVIGLAVFIFVVSIGALQGLVDLARRPIAQQLQNAVPSLEPYLHRGQQGQQQQDPNPADMAARLVAQREQLSWLQSQIRRLERAGLLFLASIAPGVAERHIANLEAEARAERERIRREAEEAEEARRRQEEEQQQQQEGQEGQPADTPADEAFASQPEPVAT